MSEYENEFENEFYAIPEKVLKVNIPSDKLDDILDRMIDEEYTSNEEEELIVLYILQLMYRSGRRTSCTEYVHEKFENLINDRRIQLLKEAGLIEEFFDTTTLEPVYVFSEKVK